MGRNFVTDSQPDYLTNTFSVGAFGVGDIGITTTRTGHIYFNLGAGPGSPAVIDTVRMGRIVGPHTYEDIDSFVNEASVTVSASGPVPVGPTVGVTWGNPPRPNVVTDLLHPMLAIEEGLAVGEPSVNAEYGWSFDISTNGPRW